VLYDNSSPTTRVHTWLEEQTKTGKLDVTRSKTLEQQYDPENCDLILWFVIGKQP
jgi:hypothetical protein